MIEGSVSGGIVLAIPPKDNSTTDPDEDDDGIEDAKEGAAIVTSYGCCSARPIGRSRLGRSPARLRSSACWSTARSTDQASTAVSTRPGY